MGIWDRIKKTESEYDEEEEREQAPEREETAGASASAGYAQRSAGGAALELKVVRPESYDAAGKIADHLLNRRTVVLNLEATNRETARRLIDFLSGVAYSINGKIQKVATNTVVITPSNVGITGESAGEEEAPKAGPKTDATDDFAF